jgi:hypothetical protein
MRKLTQKNCVKHIKKFFWIKRNLRRKFVTISVVSWDDKDNVQFDDMKRQIWNGYDKNCQIGHDIIDYAKIPLIIAMISHHWNFI